MTHPDEQRTLVEKRLSKSEALRLRTATQILEYVDATRRSGREIDEEMIERILYSYLARRRTPEEIRTITHEYRHEDGESYFAPLAGYLKEFRDPAKTGFKAQEEAIWFALGQVNSEKRSRQILSSRTDTTAEVKVIFKEYFSMVPTSLTAQGVMQELARFQGVLPELARQLTALGKANRDEISLKIPSDLIAFFMHPDSLVIHYRDQRRSGDIRKIVESVCLQHGIILGRGGRAHSGFDFDGPQRLAGSHSQLLARVLAKQMKNRIQKEQGLHYDKAGLITKIDEALNKLAEMTPAEILALLTRSSS